MLKANIPYSTLVQLHKSTFHIVSSGTTTDRLTQTNSLMYCVSMQLLAQCSSSPSGTVAGMSTRSKVVLTISVVLSVGTVLGVHVKQNLERERLRLGVVHDLERQRRKEENLRLLQEQIELTKQLESEREKNL
ncbi:unnamed protein product [Ranitomeya imitator]|uniref:PET117 cytochrome c oxidase chaperone n=2 Tax=Ranitomeya TaxID=1004436 RepID=A0ABN9KVB5_9NEOB|nr:unnamed protein product [Ranitomeya imitator]